MRLRQLIEQPQPQSQPQGAAGAAAGSSLFGLFGAGSAINIAVGNEPLPEPGATGAQTGTAPGVTGAQTGTAGSVPSGSSGATATMGLVDMVAAFEGFRADPYWDVRQWSVGYGSYAGSRDPQRAPRMQVTREQARAMLVRELQRFISHVEGVNRSGAYSWTQGQKDALASFAYNIGNINQLTGNATRSNREIANKMLEYVRAGGRVLSGLQNRRRVERQKFLDNTPANRLDYRPTNRRTVGPQ